MIQLNQQAPELGKYREDGVLDVHSVFYTIQGEGPFAGCPAVFVRLAGCNLQCPGCDTIYTGERGMYPPVSLRNEVVIQVAEGWSKGSRKPPLVVITGGEPFRQDIWPFVREVVQAGFEKVQIETNGTMFPPTLPCIATTIVCSPKKSFVVAELRPMVKHLKYVVEAGKISEEDGLPLCTMGYGGQVARPWMGFNGTIWIQPFDALDKEQNAANIKAAVETCMKFGYRMSLQTHKILGVA